MDQVQHRASLHESSVQKIARGEVPRRRRRRSRTIPDPPVSHLKVDRRVWTEAVLTTWVRGLEPNCIQIVDEHTVIVWNHPYKEV